MKLYSRKFHRRLRRGVRREVKTKAEWRKTARSIWWAGIHRAVDNAYLRAFAWPVVLGLSGGFEQPSMFWFMTALWMTWMALLCTFQLQQLTLGGSRPTPLIQFPVTSQEVWGYLFGQLLRTSRWLVYDVVICFGVIFFQMGGRNASALWGLLPAMVLMWVAIVSMCVVLFWKLPRVPYWIANGMGAAIGVAEVMFFRKGTLVAPFLQKQAEGLMWLTPPGWACQLLTWLSHARADFPVVAAGLLALFVALSIPCYRALAAGYVFWQLDEVDSAVPSGPSAVGAVGASGDEEEAAEQAEAAARMAQKASLFEVEARVRAGEFLQPRTQVGNDLLDRLLLPHSRRGSVVMDYLLASEPRWGASYCRGVVTLLVGIACVLLFKSLLGPTLVGLAFGSVCLAGLALITPLFGGQWTGFALGRIPPRLVPVCALWPIGLGEIRDVILRVNLRRFLVALPCWLLVGVLGTMIWDGALLLGLRYAFALWLMLLLFQPAALIFKYSQGTNDTSSGCLNALAITGMILLTVAAVVGAGWAVLMSAAWWWQAVGFASLGLVSFGFEAIYRGLYCRHRFDLLAKAREQG